MDDAAQLDDHTLKPELLAMTFQDSSKFPLRLNGFRIFLISSLDSSPSFDIVALSIKMVLEKDTLPDLYVIPT
jgi:hypothetical protein